MVAMKLEVYESYSVLKAPESIGVRSQAEAVVQSGGCIYFSEMRNNAQRDELVDAVLDRSAEVFVNAAICDIRYGGVGKSCSGVVARSSQIPEMCVRKAEQGSSAVVARSLTRPKQSVRKAPETKEM